MDSIEMLRADVRSMPHGRICARMAEIAKGSGLTVRAVYRIVYTPGIDPRASTMRALDSYYAIHAAQSRATAETE